MKSKIMVEESSEITGIGLDLAQREKVKVVELHVNQTIPQGGKAVKVLNLEN